MNFFDHKREQIIRLLAKDRNMEVIGNIGILSWLVKNIYPLIYKDRKKRHINIKSTNQITYRISKRRYYYI